QKRQEEVFNKAAIEPVLLIERSRPSHVIMSAETYQQLMEKLAELEDAIWGKAAEAALKNSKMVGSDKFTETLKKLANVEV
ncbi:MAG: prevent-host-death protein, partial [Okeania sp. SIO2H7]|nr:prevent-host-death protein [Okeania sp. SIO2H7]